MKAIQNPDPPDTHTSPMAHWAELRDYILQWLEEKLPPNLYYHGIHHTRDDVLPAAIDLAERAGLTPDAQLILQTAALCHDIGFTTGYQNHEQNAASIVREILPSYGFSDQQITEIIRLILATEMPQDPKSFLAALLCDADLDSLGREDYLETSLNLWQELAVYGEPIPLVNWYRRQLQFLSRHRYFTEEARTLRGAGQEKNARLLEQLIQNPEAETSDA